MIEQAVIFDMDGVLVDTEPYYLENNKRVFGELGFALPAEEYVHFVGISARRMWEELISRFRLKQSVEELIQLEYETHFRRLAALPSLEPIAGVMTLIERLKTSGAALAIASSSPRRVIELTLAKAGLAGFFPVTVSGDDVAHGKPHPDIFLEAARRAGVSPSRCLVIEDSPRGLEGAAAAGMTSIGFKNPNSGDQDLSAADLVVDRFREEDIERIIRLADSLRERTAAP
ncbi:MAG: HAD family phosphatase [Spirochaetales bacterium]|nr:HAD family phosphatase [Spirochaetales bacterium]